MNLREYLHLIAKTHTLEELWAAHVEHMARFGFDRLIYGNTVYRTETSLGDPDDFIILSNHSKAYLDGFLGAGLYKDAPMLQWALRNEGAASWRMIGELKDRDLMSPRERQVMEFNRSMGVTVGYTVSFSSPSIRSKGAISLCAREGLDQYQVDAIWARSGADIQLMNTVAHLKILTLPYNPPNRALTKRQREVLEWVGDGKTTQDIALLMGLTPATVEKHLRLAREALAVETTAQAVLKASLHNQIHVMEV
jgi:LuxR family transcriptional regulator